MRKQRTMLTVSQIVEVYKLAKVFHAKNREIVAKTGFSSYPILKSIERQMGDSKLKIKAYQKAIKILQREGLIEKQPGMEELIYAGAVGNGKVPTYEGNGTYRTATETQIDPYKRLEEAIEDVIVSAVTSKVDEVREENKTLKEELAKKTAVIDEFKQSNWFTNLKKKLEGI